MSLDAAAIALQFRRSATQQSIPLAMWKNLSGGQSRHPEILFQGFRKACSLGLRSTPQLQHLRRAASVFTLRPYWRKIDGRAASMDLSLDTATGQGLPRQPLTVALNGAGQPKPIMGDKKGVIRFVWPVRGHGNAEGHVLAEQKREKG
mmetsp:Transcript_21319/g.33358  ORF Transcript_21319/g.33358 Transcript_21319/m.33358 type:complete len:148 (+) Transcript_21319:105-548(+)